MRNFSQLHVMMIASSTSSSASSSTFCHSCTSHSICILFANVDERCKYVMLERAHTHTHTQARLQMQSMRPGVKDNIFRVLLGKRTSQPASQAPRELCVACMRACREGVARVAHTIKAPPPHTHTRASPALTAALKQWIIVPFSVYGIHALVFGTPPESRALAKHCALVQL